MTKDVKVLAKATEGLTLMQIRMAAILLKINGLQNALTFVAKMRQLRSSSLPLS